MKKSFFLVTTCLLLIAGVSCSTTTEPQYIKGRNIDSLKTAPFKGKLLAFSIELGVRSRDFDNRFERLAEKAGSREDWCEVLQFEINTPAFSLIEKHNTAYMDSLYGLISSPPDDLKDVCDLQNRALLCFKSNYALLRDCGTYASMGKIFDLKLRNDRIMNAAMMRVVGVFDADTIKHK